MPVVLTDGKVMPELHSKNKLHKEGFCLQGFPQGYLVNRGSVLWSCNVTKAALSKYIKSGATYVSLSHAYRVCSAQCDDLYKQLNTLFTLKLF